MRQLWILVLLPVAVFSTADVGWTQKPADPPAANENIEAAFKIALASAAEYEFQVGEDEKDKPLELAREPKLKWSNPSNSDVQGSVFVWTREGRPLVVGSFQKWLERESALTHWQHEFHSLAEGPLSAKFHGESVWTTEDAGVKFVAIPDAPAPAANKTQRLIQLRLLAKEFSADGRYRNAASETELRLLPQPIHNYAAPKQGILEGGIFAFVRSTDPELLLLIEARGKNAASARWRFAPARMTNIAEVHLRHQKKQVWEAPLLPWKDVSGSHRLPYTAFDFKKLPEFLNEAIAKPKSDPGR